MKLSNKKIVRTAERVLKRTGEYQSNRENGYRIVGMTMDCHYNVWSMIEDCHKGDIENLKGMQEYLDYCKKNSVTKDRLNKEMNYPGMDAITLYDLRAKSHRDLE